MNEDDWTAVWVSGLDNMQLNAATACDLVSLHRRSLLTKTSRFYTRYTFCGICFKHPNVGLLS